MKSQTTINNPIGFYRLYICLTALAIIFGGTIYILFRPSEPVFFQWIRVAGLDNMLSAARRNTFLSGLQLPDWIVYSLPNGLWSFAYSLIITGIWAGSKSWLRYVWMASIPLLVLGYEMLQYQGIIPGTFCLQDIAMGTAGLIFGILIIAIINKSNHHENKIE